MSVLPSTRRDRLTWFQNRLALWTANADAIGLSDSQVDDLAQLLGSASSALSASDIARATSKSRTLDFHGAADELSTFGAGLIKAIKAKAATEDNAGIYSLANIPAPASPSPAPPPPMPTNVETDVKNNGSVKITWKFKNNATSPVSFQIRRQLNEEGQYQILTSTAKRKFIDTAVAPGTKSVSYMIRAIRGDHTSPDSEAVTAYFGYVVGDGAGDLHIAA